MYHLTRVPGILPSVATAPFRVLQVLLFAMKFVEDRYRANKLGGVVAPEEAAEEPNIESAGTFGFRWERDTRRD